MVDDRDRDRTVRARLGDLDATAARDYDDPSDAPLWVVGKTKAIGTYPTTAKAWYAIDICSIAGDEAEGMAATLASRGYPAVRALNLGGNVPPADTAVRVDREPTGRWVFSY